MSIAWTIETLDRRASDGFVTTAHWRCTAVDGDLSASVYSTCGWPEGTPETPYNSLTPETVLSWVWANGVDKEATEAAVVAQIEAQKAPVLLSGTPWSN